MDTKSIYHTKNLDLPYYKRQMIKPYESTKAFFKFLSKHKNLKNKNIIDIGCGNGANLFFLKNNYNPKNLFGVDQNNYLLKIAKNYKKKKKINNIFFFKKNILNFKQKLNLKFKIDGAISLQTLSFLEDYEQAIKFLKQFRPSFICVSSLFWLGEIDFKIKVNFLDKKRKIKKYNDYNIYSINHYVNFLKKNGYKSIFIKFKTKKKLKTINKKLMGSYSVNLDGKKEIKSGPIILDWFFILSTKK